MANEFHLVDEDGKEHWVLSLSRDGEPNMTFINEKGWAPMALGMNKRGLPYINMVMEPNSRSGPSLVLMDRRMKHRAVLGLDPEGEPSLSLLDSAGQVRAVLGAWALKNPVTGIDEKRPCSSLALLDDQGRIIWSVPGLAALPAHFVSSEGPETR